MSEYILCDKCKKAGLKIPSACCPEQKEQILFFNDIQGEAMIKKWGGEPWIFRKHPDGQWVSCRKATERDIQEVCKKIAASRAA